MSAAWPGVRCTAMGNPCASVSTLILVLKLPYDRPEALEWLPLSWLRRPCWRARMTVLLIV
jgi:hypothetical protein